MTTAWLIQFEHGKNHDADVALREQDAFRIVADAMATFAGMKVDRSLFMKSEDHRESIRAEAAKLRFYYTIERRVLA
ncbi:MAG: hypothetical protein RLZZ444_4421 [Pseudomonadota bacterium]|jgi:hypothetical protein